MTEDIKQEILRLRLSGMGYKKIAKALNISADYVKYYCRKNNLGGYRGNPLPKEIKSGEVCKQCGKALVQPKTGRRKVFCSIECKRVWTKENPNLYTHKCRYCHSLFLSKSTKQKFCSNDCYMRDRFYRDEDVDSLAKDLKAGNRHVPTPQWIIDLITDED